jgi:hypothetical protein
MNRIYAGQTSLRITVKTFADLKDIDTAVIKYRKPDGTSGELLAVIADEAKGIIFHDCIAGEIDQAGWWVFWASLTAMDGGTAAGEPCRVYVWAEGHV